jgi:hypothetical protein
MTKRSETDFRDDPLWRATYPLFDVLPIHEAALLKLWLRRFPAEVPPLDASTWLAELGLPTSDLATWDQIARGVGYLLLESLDEKHAQRRRRSTLAYVAPVLFRVAVDFPRSPPGQFIEHRRVWVPQHERWVLTLTYLAPGRVRTSLACGSVAPADWTLEVVHQAYQSSWARLKQAQPELSFGAMSPRGLVPPAVAWAWLQAHWPHASQSRDVVS